MKERGESWNQGYFQNTLIPRFDEMLNDARFVEFPGQMLLIHDNCPGWRAGRTRQILEDRMTRGIFKTLPYHGQNGSWPGGRPDLNPAEEAIAIIKDRVWVQTIRKGTSNSKLAFRKRANRIVKELTLNESELCQNLVLSFRKRIKFLHQNRSPDGRTLRVHIKSSDY